MNAHVAHFQAVQVHTRNVEQLRRHRDYQMFEAAREVCKRLGKHNRLVVAAGRLTLQDAVAIKGSQESAGVLADRYGIRKQAVYAIRNNRHWRDCEVKFAAIKSYLK
jgi:hypothetical protein